MRERKRRWDEFTHEDHEHEGLLEADLKEHEELTKVGYLTQIRGELTRVGQGT